MSPEDAIAGLTALGFTLNEARAYVALAQGGPATGYEVALAAQIPRSAVYPALRRLVATGAARAVGGRFAAAPAEAVLGLLRQRFASSTERLEQALARLGPRPDAPEVYGVQGYERLLEEADRLVDAAERSVVASGWPRELGRLAAALGRAQQRGVFVVAFSHGALAEGFPGVRYGYGLDEAALEVFWRHRLFLVVDDRRTVLATAEREAADAAVVADAPAIAEIVTSHVALDITLLSRRYGHDPGPVVARILGERVGSLDSLLADPPRPSLGEGAPKASAKKAKRKP